MKRLIYAKPNRMVKNELSLQTQSGAEIGIDSKMNGLVSMSSVGKLAR